MLWISYFKHNCPSVKVHRNNEHSIGFQWRKWIQNRPCYGVKMKQCLGKFHYCSTNKTKEMGEERRKVKYIYVLQGWSSGRKFRVRVLAGAALDPGWWSLCRAISNQACGWPVIGPGGWRGLGSFPSCSDKPGGLLVEHRKKCLSPLTLYISPTYITHWSLLSQSLSVCYLLIGNGQLEETFYVPDMQQIFSNFIA